MSTKKPGKEGKCMGFEPQAWRRTMCKNCFRSRAEHNTGPEPGSPKTKGKDLMHGKNGPINKEQAQEKTVTDQNPTAGSGDDAHAVLGTNDSRKAEMAKSGSLNKTNSNAFSKSSAKGPPNDKPTSSGVLSPKGKRKDPPSPVSGTCGKATGVLSPKDKRKASSLFKPTKSSEAKGSLSPKTKPKVFVNESSPKEKRKQAGVAVGTKAVVSPKEKRKAEASSTLSPKEKRKTTTGDAKGTISPKEKPRTPSGPVSSVRSVFSPKEKRKETQWQPAKSVVSLKEKRRDSAETIPNRAIKDVVSPKEKRRFSLPSSVTSPKGAHKGFSKGAIKHSAVKTEQTLQDNSVTSPKELQEILNPDDKGQSFSSGDEKKSDQTQSETEHVPKQINTCANLGTGSLEMKYGTEGDRVPAPMQNDGNDNKENGTICESGQNDTKHDTEQLELNSINNEPGSNIVSVGELLSFPEKENITSENEVQLKATENTVEESALEENIGKTKQIITLANTELENIGQEFAEQENIKTENILQQYPETENREQKHRKSENVLLENNVLDDIQSENVKQESEVSQSVGQEDVHAMEENVQSENVKHNEVSQNVEQQDVHIPPDNVNQESEISRNIGHQDVNIVEEHIQPENVKQESEVSESLGQQDVNIIVDNIQLENLKQESKVSQSIGQHDSHIMDENIQPENVKQKSEVSQNIGLQDVHIMEGNIQNENVILESEVSQNVGEQDVHIMEGNVQPENVTQESETSQNVGQQDVPIMEENVHPENVIKESETSQTIGEQDVHIMEEITGHETITPDNVVPEVGVAGSMGLNEMDNTTTEETNEVMFHHDNVMQGEIINNVDISQNIPVSKVQEESHTINGCESVILSVEPTVNSDLEIKESMDSSPIIPDNNVDRNIGVEPDTSKRCDFELSSVDNNNDSRELSSVDNNNDSRELSSVDNNNDSRELSSVDNNNDSREVVDISLSIAENNMDNKHQVKPDTLGECDNVFVGVDPAVNENSEIKEYVDISRNISYNCTDEKQDVDAGTLTGCDNVLSGVEQVVNSEIKKYADISQNIPENNLDKKFEPVNLEQCDSVYSTVEHTGNKNNEIKEGMDISQGVSDNNVDEKLDVKSGTLAGCDNVFSDVGHTVKDSDDITNIAGVDFQEFAVQNLGTKCEDDLSKVTSRKELELVTLVPPEECNVLQEGQTPAGEKLEGWETGGKAQKERRTDSFDGAVSDKKQENFTTESCQPGSRALSVVGNTPPGKNNAGEALTDSTGASPKADTRSSHATAGQDECEVKIPAEARSWGSDPGSEPAPLKQHETHAQYQQQTNTTEDAQNTQVTTESGGAGANLVTLGEIEQRDNCETQPRPKQEEESSPVKDGQDSSQQQIQEFQHFQGGSLQLAPGISGPPPPDVLRENAPTYHNSSQAAKEPGENKQAEVTSPAPGEPSQAPTAEQPSQESFLSPSPSPQQQPSSSSRSSRRREGGQRFQPSNDKNFHTSTVVLVPQSPPVRQPQHQQPQAAPRTRSRNSQGRHLRRRDSDSSVYVIGRHKPTLDTDWETYLPGPTHWRRMDDMAMGNVSRDEAMVEGQRLLVETLREKNETLSEKVDKLEREKCALGDLLAARKADFADTEEQLRITIAQLEENNKRVESEKDRLTRTLRLPVSERAHVREQEREISKLQSKLEEAEQHVGESEKQRNDLIQEVKDLQVEMDEMHDQFRDDEAIEFRELQKELEATAKNCRILQFKLRKAERRNEQVEAERTQFEEKIRQLESRFEAEDDKQHIRELEEELKMAKEVSVRLHDELEMVEEKRVRYEEEVTRLQDYLKESESRRTALTNEVDELHTEIERLREEMNEDSKGKTRLGVPEKKAPLAKAGSVEYDIAQLMRDLSDSLERENDIKEQLQFTEEEVKAVRKKLSDVEDENESLNLQLKKMSSAKSGKYFKVGQEKEVITEREHDLRLQLEIAEQEIGVLKRKNEELEKHNDKMSTQVKFLQQKVMSQSSDSVTTPEEDDRPMDEKLHAMAMDIDDLKWKLIEKDQEVEKLKTKRLEPRKGMLKKSRSLDDSEQHVMDYRRQFEMVQQEANVLKERIASLEGDLDILTAENKRLQFVSRKVPSITTDDAAVQNIEMKERIKELETENGSLRDQIKSLDKRTSKLSKEVLKSASRGDATDDSEGSRDMREKLSLATEECSSLRKQLGDMESTNSRLQKELESLHKSGEKGKKSSTVGVVGEDKLQKKILEKDSEIGDLLSVVKGKEEENEKLLEEIEVYRSNISKMLDTFRVREKELLDEVEAVQQKNNVLSNLLDLVTERAESTQRELEKYQLEDTSRSERSQSAVSAISDVSTGSDDVFLQPQAGQDTASKKEWEEKFANRIDSLEQLLAEERCKVHAAEKRLALTDVPTSGAGDDLVMNTREKEILQKELTLCQQQLQEANDHVIDMKARLAKVEEAHSEVQKNFTKVSKELEQELIRKATQAAEEAKKAEIEAKSKPADKEKEKDKEKDARFKDEPRAGPRTMRSSSVGALAGKFEKGGADREPASWRWEKQDLERKVKDLTKKLDEQDRQAKRVQPKFKQAAGAEDKKKSDDTASEDLKQQLKDQKQRCETYEKQIKEFQKQISEVQNLLQTKEKQWNSERDILIGDKQAAMKEATQKIEAVKQKDDIIRKKDRLLKEKEASLKEKDTSLKAKVAELAERDNEILSKSSSSKQTKNDLAQLKDQLKDKDKSLTESEAKVKSLDEAVRNRDDRLKEKDDILEKLNRTLAEKESETNDLDNSIRKAMKKLDDREVELKTLKQDQEKSEKELVELKDKYNDVQEKYQKVLKSHANEMANLVISREKLEIQIDTLSKEKKSNEQEINVLKQKVGDQEQELKKFKGRLDSGGQTSRDRLHVHSLKTAQSSQEDENVKSLQLQVDSLENEKSILVDEVKRMRRELEESSTSWNVEREDLQKIIAEKTRLVEDNDTICRKMEEEISKLKKKLAFASSKTKGRTTSSEEEDKEEKGEKEVSEKENKHKEEKEEDSTTLLIDKSGRDKSWMRAQLERQELVYKAEKVSLEELYEQKLRTTQEQLAQALAEVDNLKRDSAAQKDLLTTSSKALSDIKSKFDTSSSTWSQERQDLEKRCKELDQARQKTFQLQKTIDDLQSKLKDEAAKRKQSDSKYNAEKSSWDIQRADFKTKLSKLEDQVATNPRAKFRQLERKDTQLERERSENRKLLEDAQRVSRDLQRQLSAAEKAREQEQKEMLTRLENNRKDFEKEQKDLRDRLSALEAKSEQLSPVQTAMIDLQYKLQANREAWLRERSELQRQLDESRKAHLADKQRFTELLAETKKLRALTPMLEEPLTPTSPTGEQHKMSTVIELSASGSRVTSPEGVSVKRSVQEPSGIYLIEALRHISRLAEELNRTESRTERRAAAPAAPPAFRRSLSTSEMEAYQAYQEEPMIPLYIGAQYMMSPDDALLTPHSRDPSPSTPMSLPGDDDRQSRPMIRRSYSTMDAPGGGGPRQPRPPTLMRSSTYVSGSQSAYTSRDASPDKRWGLARQKSPYPQPPPSMIVTPPQTPRRAPHSQSILTSENMSRLYEKLGAIGRSEEDVRPKEASYTALAKERVGRRVLMKSTSVDSTQDDPAFLTAAYNAIAGPGPEKYTHLKQACRVFEDAPKSQTLPASIRVGELIITPGIESLTKTFTPVVHRAKTKPSPSVARKNFYDNYPRDPRSFFENLAKSQAGDSTGGATSPLHHVGMPRRPRDSTSEPRRLISSVNQQNSGTGEANGKRSKSGTGPVAAFLASIKDKRKLFSAKKSSSFDSSAVHSSLARIGIKVPLAPGAPSTYEPPPVTQNESNTTSTTSTRDSRRKLFGHKRSRSVDVSLNSSASAASDSSSTAGSRGNLHHVTRDSSSSLSKLRSSRGSLFGASSSSLGSSSSQHDFPHDGICAVTDNRQVAPSGVHNTLTVPRLRPACRYSQSSISTETATKTTACSPHSENEPFKDLDFRETVV